MRTRLQTWQDLIDHVIDYWGGNPGAESTRDAKKATLRALDVLTNDSNWSYYYERGHLTLDAGYGTGTVSYDHTGGASERLVTLSGGTFPSWAARGDIVIENVVYSIAERLSDTTLTLSVHSNPGGDVASGAFQVYRDSYELPADFKAIGALTLPTHSVVLEPEHPSLWLERQRIFRSIAMPRFYTIRGSQDYQGALCLSFFPAPDDDYQVDLIYQRRPRQLNIASYSRGTVSCASGSAVLTGSGTLWTSKLEGTVIRISDSADEAPTGREGGNPAAIERIVLSVDSPTSLTMDDVADDDLTDVLYLMSDPVDIEAGAMRTVLLVCCEAQAAKTRRMNDRGEAEQEYRSALIRAREADSRNFAERAAGTTRQFPMRLADMPRGEDQL